MDEREHLMQAAFGYGSPYDPPGGLTEGELSVLRFVRDHGQLLFLDELERKGYLIRWPSGYELSQEGRNALKGKPESPTPLRWESLRGIVALKREKFPEETVWVVLQAMIEAFEQHVDHGWHAPARF